LEPPHVRCGCVSWRAGEAAAAGRPRGEAEGVRGRQIVVLEGGRAVEAGSHSALLAAGGRYAELWSRQATMEEALGQSDEEAAR